jgi:hypothetical protein
MYKEERGIRMSTGPSDIVRVRSDRPVYRIIVGFYSEPVEGSFVLIKNYYVWLSADSQVVKNGKSEDEPTLEDYGLAALSEAAVRFADSGYKVPDENGLDASGDGEPIILIDAQNYTHPVENEPSR